MGLVWLAAGFAVTVTVPGRSSLYVIYPSVGTALMAMAAGAALWRITPHSRRAALTGSIFLLPLFCLPIYWSRNARIAGEARLSTTALAFLAHALRERPDVTRVVVHEDPDAHPALRDAFGSAFPEAIALTTGRRIQVSDDHTDRPDPDAIHLRLSPHGVTVTDR